MSELMYNPLFYWPWFITGVIVTIYRRCDMKMHKYIFDMTDSEFLVSLAQNDYMIDNHYLPAGEYLLEIAERLKKHEEEYNQRNKVFNEQLKQNKIQSDRDMRDR